MYISLLDRYRHEDYLRKATWYAIGSAIKEHESDLDLPPLTEYEKLSRWGREIDCDLIRRVAIERRDD